MAKIGKLQVKIWGLDTEIKTLQSVRNLLNINYHEPIEYLSDYDNLGERDKTLMHSWGSVSPDKVIQIQNGNAIENVNYFTATGFLEAALPISKAFADDSYSYLLSRDRRVNNYTSNVIFLNFRGRIYSIIYGGSSSFNVKTILMGNGFKNRKKAEWGKIDDKPAQYNLSNDFFYWAFNKHHNQLPVNTIFGNIEIRDIKGIGRLSERTQCDTKGTGPNYVNEISSKSSLGSNQSVYESDFELVTSKVNAIMCLDQYTDCIIDMTRSFFPEGDLVIPIFGKEDVLLLHIYLEIIPGLISVYNKEKALGEWTISESAAARRRWALDVINELCLFNQLTLDEITGLPFFNNAS